jgi:hypothetical protein
MIYNILVHAHSIIRWMVLIFIVLALLNAFLKIKKRAFATCKDCAFNRLTMVFAHLQLVAGFVLYFISPKVIFEGSSMKDPLLRFFLVEHILLMLVSIALITIGYIKADRSQEDQKKYRFIMIYYGIAFLLLLLSIPWPFRDLGSGWY